jgi:hypothetical protein
MKICLCGQPIPEDRTDCGDCGASSPETLVTNLTHDEVITLAAKAAKVPDLDAACLLIQQRLGVTSGDLASHIWTGDEWKWHDEDLREQSLQDYIWTEMTYYNKEESA